MARTYVVIDGIPVSLTWARDIQTTEEEPMPHAYEGTPDARQSSDEHQHVSRFAPVYRALSAEEKELHDDIKAKAAELEALFVRVRHGRYLALSLTALEEAVMWNIKGLTSSPAP